ncbi:MAG TPA: glycosyltransferase family 4 protein [Pseudogracilibacillus sp.]|nr:glycosyltransferase family 4 protein [Pseudogracilibacillus sp.]
MKIMQLITHMHELGGAQMHLYELSKRLSADGHEVILAASGECMLTEELVNEGIDYLQLKWLGVTIKPYNDVRAFLEIRKILKEIQPDLIAIHSSKAGIIGRLAAKSLNIPVMFTAHSWSFAGEPSKWKRKLFLTLEKLVGKWTDGVIAVSTFDYNQALSQQVVPIDKIRKIHNGIPDDERCFQRYRTNEGCIDLLMVARFAEPKDHYLLFQTLSQITSVRWRLTLVGGGPLLNEYRQLAQRLEIDRKINFAGETRDVIEYMKQADIFVLLSKSEGLPLSIIEAMREGIPVIASDVGGVSEILQHGRQGFLVKKGDRDFLTKALLTLMSSEELRRKYGNAGRNRFIKEFSFEKMYDQTEMFYRIVAQNSVKAEQKEVQL